MRWSRLLTEHPSAPGVCLALWTLAALWTVLTAGR